MLQVGFNFYKNISLKWQPRSTNPFPCTSRQLQSPEWAKKKKKSTSCYNIAQVLMGTRTSTIKKPCNDPHKGNRINQRYC